MSKDSSFPPSAAVPANEAHRAFERLMIITRANAYVQHERQWLHRLEVKAGAPLALAARKIGFGPWRKHHSNEQALVTALDLHWRAKLEAQLHVPLPAPLPTDAPDTFDFEWPSLSGEPVLHDELLADSNAYLLSVSQDDTKHVAHRLVACWMHAFIRQVVADKRVLGDAEVCARTGLSPQQVYAFEVNLCQHYVPSGTVAYFEKQPIRAFAWDFANRVRKVAFGGQ